MNALLAFLTLVASNMSTLPHACVSEPSVSDASVTCDGSTYGAGHFRLVHDSDDGEIIAVQVWQ